MDVDTSGLEVRRSQIHGRGVFARRPIAAGTYIVDYAGELLSTYEARQREARDRETGELWCFNVDGDLVRDAAVGGNIARFINHSCAPNCVPEIACTVIWIRAIRDIAAGEELTYTYGTQGHSQIRCLCRPRCRTRL